MTNTFDICSCKIIFPRRKIFILEYLERSRRDLLESSRIHIFRFGNTIWHSQMPRCVGQNVSKNFLKILILDLGSGTVFLGQRPQNPNSTVFRKTAFLGPEELESPTTIIMYSKGETPLYPAFGSTKDLTCG